MFIRKVHKKNDYISFRIVESYREKDSGKVKQKSMCCVGQAHKGDQQKLEFLARTAEELLVKLRNEEKPALPGLEEDVHGVRPKKAKDYELPKNHVSIEGLKEELRTSNGIEDIFGVMYDRIGLKSSIASGYKQEEANEILKKLVLMRVKDPQSKKQSVYQYEQEKADSLNLDRVYRMMDKLYDNEKRVKSKISSTSRSFFKQKVDVAFFDVTTLYFESFTPDDLRRSGFSKDNKVKETQVMLALMTTSEGIPLGYTLFPGNTYEGHTLIAAIEELQTHYCLENTYLVADRGMFNSDNLSALEDLGVKYIVAAKIKTLKKRFKEEILDDFCRLKKQKKDFLLKEYKLEDGKRRLIVSFSEKRASKDKKDRERLVERLKKQMDSSGKVEISKLINNRGTKKYLKIEQVTKTGTLNEEKIKKELSWDGLYGVITNNLEGEMSAGEVLENYKGLWQIEEAFRVNKHDLKMRPIYHWNEKRIKAHILMCYMAYALSVYVRKTLKDKGIKLSFRKIRQELNYCQESMLYDEVSGYKFLLPSKKTQLQEKIYNAFGLNIITKAKKIM